MDRRQFLQLLALGSMAINARAQTGQRVEESEALAMKLGYRMEASQVDTVAFPKRSGVQGERQFCYNCALYEGEPGDREAACSIFQGRLVAGKGWCNAWVARS